MREITSHKRESMTEQTLQDRKLNTVGLTRFIILSLVGIFSFFITFNIGTEKTFLVNHVTIFIRTYLAVILPYFVLLLGLIGVVNTFANRAKYFRDIANITLSVFRILGLIMILMVIFKVGPGFIMQESVAPLVFANILVPISVTIVVAAMFLPFLLDFGLIDFFGVIMRPIMRPLFKTPGLSSVIAVSAFLGNFSIGHIAVDSLQREGKLNQKEAFIIGTGFCTVSVAFLMVIASTLGILQYWNFYFWSAFIITIIVTIVQVRIWPSSKKNEEYLPGATPNPEKVFKTALLKNAFYEGVDVAAKQTSLLQREKIIMRDSLLILGSFISTVMFFGALGILIDMYTPLIQYIGYIFYPFLWLVQVPGADLAIAMKTCAISLVDSTLTAIVATSGGELSLVTKYVLAVLPVSTIVFISGFIPCIMSTNIRVSFGELLVIWLERAILTILLAGVVGLIFF